jgi:hypothetical protein
VIRVKTLVAAVMFWFIGLCLMAVAGGAETDNYGTLNLGLMQSQMMALHAGIGSMIIGAIFSVGSGLVGAMARLGEQQALDMSPEAAAELAGRKTAERKRTNTVLGVIFLIIIVIGVMSSLKQA